MSIYLLILSYISEIERLIDDFIVKQTDKGERNWEFAYVPLMDNWCDKSFINRNDVL